MVLTLSSSKMEDLSVEVCGENGAYYKAFITDIHDEEVSVAFENDPITILFLSWQPESKFPFRRVRLPPTPKEGDKNEIVEGQEVEVYSRANEQEACGWWRALVKMTKGESYVVDYLGRETTYTENVPGERLRPQNTNPPLTKNTFHKFELQVPEDLREYLKVESTHEEFKKAIAAVVCKFNPEKNCLIIIFSSQARSEVLNKRATLLSDMHFRNEVLLLEAARQLENLVLDTTSFSSPEGSRLVELAKVQSKLRRLLQELDEKNETMAELKEQLERHKNLSNRLKNENLELVQGARTAKAYEDEIDILEERGLKVEKLEREIQGHKDKLKDLEYYRSRMEEIRQENKTLTDIKIMLEDQLESCRKKLDKIPELESELVKFQSKTNELETIKDSTIEELSSRTSSLERENKQLTKEIENLSYLSVRCREQEKENRELVQQVTLTKKTLAALRQDLASEKIHNQQVSSEIDQLIMLQQESVKEEKEVQVPEFNENISLLEEELQCDSANALELIEPSSLRSEDSDREYNPKEISSLKSTVASLERKLVLLDKENRNFRNQATTLKDQNATLTNEVELIQQKHSSINKQNTELHSKLAKLEVETSLLKSQNSSLTSQNTNYQCQVAAYEDRVKLSTRSTVGSGYLEELSVRDDLMGLAIGAHGANIQNARDLEGITGIDLDETTCTFYSCVPGETSISDVLFDDEDPQINDQLIRLTDDNRKLRALTESMESRLTRLETENKLLNQRILGKNQAAISLGAAPSSPTGEQAAKRRINTPRKNTPGKNTPRKYTPRKKPVDIDKIIVALDKDYEREWVFRDVPGHNVSDVFYKIPTTFDSSLKLLRSKPDVVRHLEEFAGDKRTMGLTVDNFNFEKRLFTNHRNERKRNAASPYRKNK